MQNIWLVLSLNSLAFGVNFAIWTILAILGLELKNTLVLSYNEFALLLAMPFLSGALLRIPMDMLAEKINSRLILTCQLMLSAVPIYMLAQAQEYWEFLVLAALIGVSGATFSLGMHYVNTYFPERQKGLALALYSAGVLGLAVTYSVMPILIETQQWRNALHMASFTFAAFALLYGVLTFSRRLPTRAKIGGLRQHLEHIGDIQVWRFGLYYFFVFGCFMACAVWLPFVYSMQFNLSLVNAGLFSLCFVLPAVVGRIACIVFFEKYSVTTINWAVFWICMVCLFFLSFPATSLTIHGVDREIQLTIELNIVIFSLLIAIMGFTMGLGTSSIYRLISKYYPDNQHGIAGLVSSIGALGGFVLPVLFGLLLQVTGVLSSCFILLYVVLGSCMIWMYYAIKRDEFDHRVQQAINNNFLQEGSDPFES